MAKYHIKADGSPGKCNAQKGNCPFGENAPHFESIEAAQQFADLKNRIEVEDDFSLSWNKIYSLNKQEADSLVNSIDKVVGEIDNEIQAVESEMRKLTMTEEWFDYKDSEEDFEEAKRGRIRISNSDDDHTENMPFRPLSVPKWPSPTGRLWRCAATAPSKCPCVNWVR